jgi:DNA-binding Lrp family transcriptional regulator
MIDELDKRIIGLIQGDLPLHGRPFAVMADRLGISEQEFIERVRAFKKKGILRRFGATLRHQEAGFSANAMVAWVVPEDRVARVGGILAGFRQVTHCYQRKSAPDWRYNVYSMIHGSSREECREIAAEMAGAVGVTDYSLLFSELEFKKTSMEYF